MACDFPKLAFQREAGAPVSFRPIVGGKSFQVPCGRCRGCRLERSRTAAIRCVHEAQLHDQNAFITLTYDDEHLPRDWSLDPKALQDFWKRLRERVAPRRIRYFACGEYGEEHGRPHYHACVFGLGFHDRVFWKKSGGGEPLYRSSLLEALWPFGHSSVGNVTFESAAYVARYIMKKELGQKAGPRRAIIDPTTGEMWFRSHEFSRQSLKPGLGRGWLERFSSDVYPHGAVVHDGHEVKPPRYYDKWFEAKDPAAFEALRAARLAKASARWDDNHPARLRAREAILEARVNLLIREL